MGGSAFSKHISEYAKAKGIYLIAVGKVEDAPYKTISDESYMIDTMDVDRVVALIKHRNIDGVFVGASEENISSAITISELAGLPFYTNRYQWDALSNKLFFKKLLKEHDIGVTEELCIECNGNSCNFENVQYPVIIKPVDGAGAKGIYVCNNKEELANSYSKALNYSKSKMVVVEKYLQETEDFFVRYHLQDGVFSISSSFDKYVTSNNNYLPGLPLAYLHPSKYLDSYIKHVDNKMKKAFNSLKLNNGMISLQGLVDKNNNFYFYEAGYRLGGSQSYIFTDALNNSNSLHYMINYAITGKMASFNIINRDDPYFKKPCCNLYIPLHPGNITEVKGIKSIRNMPEVLNVTEMFTSDVTIKNTGNLDQVWLRMHILAKDKRELSEAIDKINRTLSIFDEYGNDMVIERFDLDVMHNSY